MKWALLRSVLWHHKQVGAVTFPARASQTCFIKMLRKCFLKKLPGMPGRSFACDATVNIFYLVLN